MATEEGGLCSGEDQRLRASNALRGGLTAGFYHTYNHSTREAKASQGNAVKPCLQGKQGLGEVLLEDRWGGGEVAYEQGTIICYNDTSFSILKKEEIPKQQKDLIYIGCAPKQEKNFK